MNREYRLCLNLLNVSENASVSDIKRAYRKLAKAYHPDVNPSKNAQEKFQQITKAYHYALAVKTGKVKITPSAPSQDSRPTNPNKKYGTHQNWNSEANQKAREKAREQAKKHFDTYVNSEEYKLQVIFSRFFKYLALIIVLFLVSYIIYTFITLKPYSAAALVVGGLIGFPMWWAYVRLEFKSMSVLEFKELFGKLSKTYLFWTITLGITNLLLLFGCTLYTVISTNFILIGLALLTSLTYLISSKVKEFSKRKSQYLSLGILPFIINLIFLINYSLSSDTETNVYKFKYSPFERSTSVTADGLIYLPEDLYGSEYFLRTFYINRPENQGYVSYTSATGLFGIEVVKDSKLYQFQPNSPFYNP